MPIGLSSRLHADRTLHTAGFGQLPSGLGSENGKEDDHVYAHGTSGEDLPHSLHRLQDGACQPDAPRSVHDMPRREGSPDEESAVHGLLHGSAMPHAPSAIHRVCVALRISLPSGALHDRILRTAHGLPESPLHGLQLRLRNTDAQGSVHGVPPGVRDKVRVAESLRAASGSVHADNLQAARRVPPGARPNLLSSTQLLVVLRPDLHGLRRLMSHARSSDSNLTQRAGQLDQPVSYSQMDQRGFGVFCDRIFVAFPEHPGQANHGPRCPHTVAGSENRFCNRLDPTRCLVTYLDQLRTVVGLVAHPFCFGVQCRTKVIR